MVEEYSNEEIRQIFHLKPEISSLLCLSNEERLKYLERDIWIEYPAVRKGLRRMKELLGHEQRSRMPNLLVIGKTNNGKTMLKEKFHRENKDQIVADEINGQLYSRLASRSILSIQMPSIPNLKRFLLSLAVEVDALYHLASTTLGYMEMELYRIIKQLQVKMIMIDELHNILASPNRQQLEILNMLRYVGNELKVPLVCFGTKGAYMAISRDPQLENRFEPVTLPLWKEGSDLEILLKGFSSILPLKGRSDLLHSEIIKFLLTHSGGILGEIAVMLKKAAILAIRSGKEKIDLKLLEELDHQSPLERRRDFNLIIAEP